MQQYWRDEFPQLVSYGRFVKLMASVLVPLTVYLHEHFGDCTGVSFIDSTALAACRNARIRPHRVFACDAARGKTSVGWVYGFKLHLVVNDRGELLACCLTRGNVDDRRPVLRLVRHLFGKLFGDRGYISQRLANDLFVRQGLRLITKLRKNMHQRLLTMTDKVLLRKRAIIETIYDQLTNRCQIEHSRHRSPRNFRRNLLADSSPTASSPRNPPCIWGTTRSHSPPLARTDVV